MLYCICSDPLVVPIDRLARSSTTERSPQPKLFSFLGQFEFFVYRITLSSVPPFFSSRRSRVASQAAKYAPIASVIRSVFRFIVCLPVFRCTHHTTKTPPKIPIMSSQFDDRFTGQKARFPEARRAFSAHRPFSRLLPRAAFSERSDPFTGIDKCRPILYTFSASVFGVAGRRLSERTELLI